MRRRQVLCPAPTSPGESRGRYYRCLCATRWQDSCASRAWRDSCTKPLAHDVGHTCRGPRGRGARTERTPTARHVAPRAAGSERTPHLMPRARLSEQELRASVRPVLPRPLRPVERRGAGEDEGDVVSRSPEFASSLVRKVGGPREVIKDGLVRLQETDGDGRTDVEIDWPNRFSAVFEAKRGPWLLTAEQLAKTLTCPGLSHRMRNARLGPIVNHIGSGLTAPLTAFSRSLTSEVNLRCAAAPPAPPWVHLLCLLRFSRCG